MTEHDQRIATVSEAREWISTPFHHGASVKGPRGGVDCGTFLIAVYRFVGIPVPVSFGHFDPKWHLHTSEERYMDILLQYADVVDEPQGGDIVMFRLERVVADSSSGSRVRVPGPFSHSGIVIDWPHFIHASLNRSGQGFVQEDDAMLRPELRGREVKFLSPWRHAPA